MTIGFTECGNIFFLLAQDRFVPVEINYGKLSFLNREFMEGTNQYGKSERVASLFIGIPIII